MRILGIDYGRRKIGLAFSEGKLAEPLKILRYSDIKILREEIKKTVKEHNIEKIVVGVSEGKMGEESKDFSLSLSISLRIPVKTFDETLTTQEAQRLSIEAGITRSKRKELEDAYAACVMLQSYLEVNHV